MDNYELLDFGDGRKLERFSDVVIDRVSPAAEGTHRAPRCDWSQADVKLDTKGRIVSGHPPANWQCRLGAILFNLKLTPFGHVGLFPEQADNWNWLQTICHSITLIQQQPPIQALNLFAYTGGSTLALAAAGAEVVHVDASAPAVKWGQRNAASSGLAEHSIRWLVDDARKFVRRELRRDKRYHIIVLDPPSFGHGAGGQRWSIDQDLQTLLVDCLQLLTQPPNALLLTAHSESPQPMEIADWINAWQVSVLPSGTQRSSVHCEHARLSLLTSSGKTLDAGFYVRATDVTQPTTC